MIQVTRFNRSTVYLNATLIEAVEATPDTVISLITGKKFVVAETVPDVLDKIQTFYRNVGLVAVQARQLKAEGTDVS
ncbi:flagellar protein FlbD [Tumebacillus sp. BK434]|uniref:flagellar FlbD family protein n=1 Tax=Tumebacillus sp. BK434 TaxID=2512169 RepID=UPI001052649F|nr:flagellar FlbD family protein [Tumebacillus sp. BK434]TCP58827.1 flagellar protein FlbD [Tumebacillus sp. BK434]